MIFSGNFNINFNKIFLGNSETKIACLENVVNIWYKTPKSHEKYPVIPIQFLTQKIKYILEIEKKEKKIKYITDHISKYYYYGKSWKN